PGPVQLADNRHCRLAGARGPPGRRSGSRHMILTITAIVLALIGLFLTGGGVWLIMLGGSPFYLFAGLMFLATAALLYLRHRAALWAYATLVLVALVWAIWEVGFDWWQLAPRGGIVVLVGLWLLTPWVRRPLLRVGEARPASPWPLAATIVLSIVVAAYAMGTPSHDLSGTLPTDRIASADFGGDVPPGEWHQYGRTPFGQRYSPLDQITPDNVSSLRVA